MHNTQYGQPNNRRLPPWLKKSFRNLKSHDIKRLLRKGNLHTVCESAKCPNIFECFSKPTAAFMILGNICSRNCGFCAVFSGEPLPVNSFEPEEIAKTTLEMGLRHVVITSVTRDDLEDGGTKQFVLTINAIRKMNSDISIEILTPDFNTPKIFNKNDRENLPLIPSLTRRGSGVVNNNYTGHIEKILNEILKSGKPDIYNHNIETVPRLYPKVRPQADYNKSLKLLETVKKQAPEVITKSGIMVGLGEEFDEVVNAMRDLRKVGCDAITIGQYLQPSKNHLPVERFIYPEVFDQYKEIGNELGFKYTTSGPFVRSSYNAERQGRN